jgi:hypothetical protein
MIELAQGIRRHDLEEGTSCLTLLDELHDEAIIWLIAVMKALIASNAFHSPSRENSSLEIHCSTSVKCAMLVKSIQTPPEHQHTTLDDLQIGQIALPIAGVKSIMGNDRSRVVKL